MFDNNKEVNSGVNKDNRCIKCGKIEQRQKFFFAGCQHNGSCIKCAQDQMKRMLKDNKQPICFLNKNCKAKMICNDHSLYQYFSTTAKQSYQKFKKRQNRPQLKHLPKCMIVNCEGLIDRTKCIKCSQDYCQNCGGFSHSPKLRCKKLIQNKNKCPKCYKPFTNNQFKITCQQCSYEFCKICFKEWSLPHQECILKTLQNDGKMKDKKCCTIM